MINVNSKPNVKKPKIKPSGQRVQFEPDIIWNIPMISFMPHHNPTLDFPHSRDYYLESILCNATKCVANRDGKCVAPSACVIGEDGRCVNYKERK